MVRRNGSRFVAVGFWVVLLVLYQVYAWRSGLTPLDAVRALAVFLSENPLGAVVFLGVYVVRPLVLFPATLLTVAAGFVFGPVLGVALTVVGSNASAMVACGVGRLFGGDVLRGSGDGIVRRYADRMRTNSFESVLLMRFIYLPYDLVNYTAGFLKIKPLPFLLATALGSLPGTLSFVLFGASFGGGELSGGPSFDWRVFAASAALLILSLALSRYFRSRENTQSPTITEET
ncbi:MAG: TVP38/TMEM64 family protein [Rubrobacter sp.]